MMCFHNMHVYNICDRICENQPCTHLVVIRDCLKNSNCNEAAFVFSNHTIVPLDT